MKVQGKQWTPEGRIIAALVVKLGGKVHVTAEELSSVEGLLFSNVSVSLPLDEVDEFYLEANNYGHLVLEVEF